MIKKFILLIIISIVLSGCSKVVEVIDNTKNNRVEPDIDIEKKKDDVEVDVNNKKDMSISNGDTSIAIPEKRKVDFWDNQFGYEIIGESEVYIA